MGKKVTKYFRAGNVVRLKDGGIVILTGYRTVNDYRVMDWIPIEYDGASGCTPEFTEKEDCMCWECGINDGGVPEGCETCNDTGKYMGKRYGMDKAKLLAPNVKDYIVSRLTKNFEF